jgi:hypothetical protein
MRDKPWAMMPGMAVPAEIPFTTPWELTVATFSLLLCQVITSFLEAGESSAFSFKDEPFKTQLPFPVTEMLLA